MQNKEKKCRVLLVGSDLSVKGGIVSVLKNYLAYDKWENVKLYYVPTHVDKKGAQKAIYFIKSLRKVLNLQCCALYNCGMKITYRYRLWLGKWFSNTNQRGKMYEEDA